MKPRDMPKISIITPNLNGARTIERTIKSIVSQPYTNKEYIIVDGGSTDGSLEIINKYSRDIDQLIVEKDDGISDAFNKGIRRANGDLVGITNSDDYLADNVLATIADTYMAQGQPDVIYGDTGYIDGDTMLFVKPEPLSKFFTRLPLMHPSVFVARSTYAKYGLFEEEYRYAMDYDLMLRFYVSGARFFYLNKILAIYIGGGNNQRYMLKTIRDVRNISIQHGFPKRRADMYMLLKIAKFLLKQGILCLHLDILIRAYRRTRKRFYGISTNIS